MKVLLRKWTECSLGTCSPAAQDARTALEVCKHSDLYKRTEENPKSAAELNLKGTLGHGSQHSAQPLSVSTTTAANPRSNIASWVCSLLTES